MSRKKAAKGKAGSSSPSVSSPTGKGTGKASRSSPMNGVVHPSRPSVSSSSEFYDIVFKVGCGSGAPKQHANKCAFISIISHPTYLRNNEGKVHIDINNVTAGH